MKLTDGFVEFENRDWTFVGDKGTWARYDENARSLTVNVARKGTISSAYIDELTEFCAAYGIDFAALRKGERVTVEVAEEEETEAAEVVEQITEQTPAMNNDTTYTGGSMLLDCVKTLLAQDDADELRLNDGAYTWDLYNLYDQIVDAEEEDLKYSIQHDGIYQLDGDGMLVFPPMYKFERPHVDR